LKIITCVALSLFCLFGVAVYLSGESPVQEQSFTIVTTRNPQNANVRVSFLPQGTGDGRYPVWQNIIVPPGEYRQLTLPASNPPTNVRYTLSGGDPPRNDYYSGNVTDYPAGIFTLIIY